MRSQFLGLINLDGQGRQKADTAGRIVLVMHAVVDTRVLSPFKM